MRSLTVSAGLLAAAAVCAPAGGADEPQPFHAPTIQVPVRLEIDGAAGLKAEDVTYAEFPSGKRCAFTFFGARSPETIGVLTKLGFRTTVYADPSTPPGTLKALEEAGADIGINIWNGKGGYSSHIQGNTVQEAYDAVATSRIVMSKSCAGPLGAAAIAGHYSTLTFPVDRTTDKDDGCGFTYHDSNYLLLSDNKPYMVYLGRRRFPTLANRDNFDNRIDSRDVPNEIIYYQILANQFRGTLRRAARGQIVRFSLRDFKAPDLTECAEVIGPFGNHKDVWNATETEIGANEMIRQKVHVEQVNNLSGAVEIVLGVEQDTFTPYLLSPLPIRLPKGVKVRRAVAGGVDCPVTAGAEAVYVDVPLREALGRGVAMGLKTAAPDMSVPEEMPVELTIRNTSDAAMTGVKLRWAGGIGFTVSGGTDAAFDLPAGGEKVIQAVAKTAAGARFGITPFQAILSAGEGEAARTWMQSFEVVVAPMLRLEMDPAGMISMFPGRSQYFLVHIDNRKSTSGGAPNTLISHRAGPCKGTVALDLPPRMRVEPAEQPFELGADDSQTLVFKVTNDAWSDEIAMVAPVIKLAGASQPLTVPFPGTRWLRKQSQIGYKPL
ncbi:MAG TPA: hypothetical protein VM389_11820, partial [Phycisphaerae bacterium]|nr:hypothetical protein [Phycisphaerae bacterium]